MIKVKYVLKCPVENCGILLESKEEAWKHLKEHRIEEIFDLVVLVE